GDGVSIEGGILRLRAAGGRTARTPARRRGRDHPLCPPSQGLGAHAREHSLWVVARGAIELPRTRERETRRWIGGQPAPRTPQERGGGAHEERARPDHPHIGVSSGW